MIEKTYSFKKDGKQNEVYTLSNTQGMQVDILTYGARITRIVVPDKNGRFDDVVVGCKRAEDYYAQNPYFGATVGRYANRIGGATFSLNGKTYRLQANERNNILHGGVDGDFSRKIWQAAVNDNTLVLSLLSPDGESGFPGNLQVQVAFTLTEDNALVLDYQAVCDKDTVCNLTNHTYFNIGRQESVLSHELFIRAKQMTPCDDELIPHGEVAEIDGTPFSFWPAKPIGKDIFAKEGALQQCGGYDFNYVLSREGEGLRHFASLYDAETGRKMDCFTTLPGVQLYTANGMNGFHGKKTYAGHCAVCLETQFFPNAPNCPAYPSALLRAGEKYAHTTLYQFSADKTD